MIWAIVTGGLVIYLVWAGAFFLLGRRRRPLTPPDTPLPLAASTLIALGALGVIIAGPSAQAPMLAPTPFPDREGRTVHVRAEGVHARHAARTAEVMRGVLHGDEVRDVLFRLMPDEDVRAICGDDAAACYRREQREIILPARDDIASIIAHEYGHHIDATIGASGDGAPGWYRLRGIGEKTASGDLGVGHDHPWDRRVEEVFADDVTALSGFGQMCNPVVGCMSDTVRAALGEELRRLLANPSTPGFVG